NTRACRTCRDTKIRRSSRRGSGVSWSFHRHSLNVIRNALQERRPEVVAVPAGILDVRHALLREALGAGRAEGMEQEASANPDRPILRAVEAMDALWMPPFRRVGHRGSDADDRLIVALLMRVPRSQTAEAMADDHVTVARV